MRGSSWRLVEAVLDQITIAYGTMAFEFSLVIALIETVAGIANAEAMMAVDGIDVGWLGHFDLTNSMGIPGQFDHPDFLAATTGWWPPAAVTAKPAGVFAGSVETAGGMAEARLSRFRLRHEISLLQKSQREGLDRLRAGEHRRPSIAADAIGAITRGQQRSRRGGGWRSSREPATRFRAQINPKLRRSALLVQSRARCGDAVIYGKLASLPGALGEPGAVPCQPTSSVTST